jgi:succinate dehydrogenase / fumarate reductase membrane anchor subunit
MVSNITSLTGQGLKDWFIQRITAAYLFLYTLGLFTFAGRHFPLDYATWQGLFHCGLVKIATILALLAVLLHAWIGIWTVTTDYIKCTCLRVSVQLLVMLLLLSQFLFGLIVIGGQ